MTWMQEDRVLTVESVRINNADGVKMNSIVRGKNYLFGLQSWLSKLERYDVLFSLTRSHNGGLRLTAQSLDQKWGETEAHSARRARSKSAQQQFTLLDNYSSFRIRGSYQWQMTLAGKATMWQTTLGDSACHMECVSMPWNCYICYAKNIKLILGYLRKRNTM